MKQYILCILFHNINTGYKQFMNSNEVIIKHFAVKKKMSGQKNITKKQLMIVIYETVNKSDSLVNCE